MASLGKEKKNRRGNRDAKKAKNRRKKVRARIKKEDKAGLGLFR